MQDKKQQLEPDMEQCHDWFKIGKGIRQGCILSSSLFNLYAEYILQNAGLDEAQAGIKIAGRNINNLRYVDDTTLMTESEEKLKSPLMKVKEESEKDGLKLNIQKAKIMASGPITSWQTDAMILAFWMLSFKPTFSLSFHFHQKALQFFFIFCPSLIKSVSIIPTDTDIFKPL